MKYNLYQIDAFTNKTFGGNPACVVPLENWLSDDILLKISKENAVAETAFFVMKENKIHLRWFTPEIEMDLCGHATLATAFVLKNCEGFTGNVIPFYSHRSGHLPVTINEDSFTMNFPCDTITEVELTDELKHTSNKEPLKAFKGKTDYMLVFEKTRL